MTQAGDLIGLYRIDRPLGQGAMAAAYAATQQATGQRVCLKIVHQALASDPEVRTRLSQEAALAQQIVHPGVARVFSLEEADGQLFLVMELLEGEPLSELLARRPLSAPRAAALVRQACQAVAAAHAVGVVHRDLKPANMVVSPSGHLHVVDFGVARQAGAAGLTQPGKVVGSVAYLAPELWEGASASVASDIWSLGVTLYRALTGRLPFPGEDLMSISDAIRLKTPPPPSTIREDLDPRFDDLLASVLAKDPKQRPASAEQLDGLLSPWTPDARTADNPALSDRFLAVAAGEGEPEPEAPNPWSASANRTMLVRREEPETHDALDEPTLDVSRAPPASKEGPPLQKAMLAAAGLFITLLLTAIVVMLWPDDDTDARSADRGDTGMAAEPADAAGAPTEASGVGKKADAAADASGDASAAPEESEDDGRGALDDRDEDDQGGESDNGDEDDEDDEGDEDDEDDEDDETDEDVDGKEASSSSASADGDRQAKVAEASKERVDRRRRRRASSGRTSTKSEQRTAYKQERAMMEAEVKARGLIGGDVAALDKARRQIKTALRKRRWKSAAAAAERGRRAAQGVSIDRAFVTKKLKRFNRRYDAVSDDKKDVLGKLSVDIAKAMGAGRYDQANKLLNRGFKIARRK